MIMNWIPSSLEGTAPQSKDGGGIVSSRIDLGNGEAVSSYEAQVASWTVMVESYGLHYTTEYCMCQDGLNPRILR